MFLYKKELSHTYDQLSRNRCPSTMDLKVASSPEFDTFFVTKYTPNAGDGLKRLEERQVWDVKYAEYLPQSTKKPVLATVEDNVAHKDKSILQPCQQPPLTWIYRRGTCWFLPTFLATDLPTPPSPFTAMSRNVTLAAQRSKYSKNQQYRLENRLLAHQQRVRYRLKTIMTLRKQHWKLTWCRHLNLSDLEKSRHFYCDLLGFSVEYERPEENFSFLSLEDCQLMLEEGST